MGILAGNNLCLGQESAEWASFRGARTMANDEKPQKNRADGTARSNKMTAAPTERPFDKWLHKQLHAMYDEIAREPLPDDLVHLIERDAKKADSGSEEK